jgi:hypothetical protein
VAWVEPTADPGKADLIAKLAAELALVLLYIYKISSYRKMILNAKL